MNNLIKNRLSDLEKLHNESNGFYIIHDVINPDRSIYIECYSVSICNAQTRNSQPIKSPKFIRSKDESIARFSCRINKFINDNNILIEPFDNSSTERAEGTS